MKIFDFNIHLPFLQSPNVNDVIAQDLALTEEELSKGFHFHKPYINKVNGANFLLFNQSLCDTTNLHQFHHDLKDCESYSLTNLIDFRRKDITDYLDQVKISGIKSVMVNSYLQKISDEDFNLVLKAFKYAESLGLMICIDGSYGTSKMLRFDNLKLACHISDHIIKAPIIIIHSGGKRVLDMMLLALDKPNIYLDTSFSLPYYVGSSLEMDFAFGYKKMGIQRVIFGSDHPYHTFDEALQVHLNFFQDHKFSDKDIEQIMYANAMNLLNIDE